MLLLNEVTSSQITKAERWVKLYRTIHHLFLREEFIHKNDYAQMMTEMNARITAIEALMTSELSKVAAALVSHTHPVVTNGGPTTQAGIAGPSPAVFTPAPQPTKPPVPATIHMEAADAFLVGLGPAQAPLSDGMSADKLRANTTILTDIGV